MERALEALVRCAARWPKTVLLAVFLGLVVSWASLAQLNVLGNVDEIGGTDFESVRFTREMNETFKAGTTLYLTFERQDGTPLPSGDLCAVKEVIAAAVLKSGVVRSVVSPLHLRTVSPGNGTVRLSNWVDFPCRDDASARYVALARASPWKTLFLGAQAAEDASTEPRDVFVEMTFDVPFVRKATDVSPLPFQSVLDIVHQEIAAHVPHLKVTASGPGAFQLAFRKALEADMGLTLAGLVVILLLCRIALGTWRSGVVLCGLIAVLGTYVFAVLAVCGIAIDPLNNGLLLMVSVAGLQDYLFIGLSRAKAATLTDKAVRASLACFLTSVTTAVGFGALGVSDLAIIREFGLVAGGAAALEWLLMFVCLPAFDSLGWLKLAHVEPKWITRTGGAAAFFDTLLRKSLPRSLAVACVAMLAFGLYSLRDLRVNDDLKAFFDTTHPFRTGLAEMKQRRGFEGNIALLTDLSNRAEVERVYASLARLPEVSGVLNPVDVLSFVAKEAGDPIEARALETLALESPALQPWFDGQGRGSGRVFVKDIELASLTRLLDRVRTLCGPTCKPYGSLVSYEDYSSTIIPSLFRSLSVAFLFVTLTLGWLAWRSRQLARLPQILAGSFWGPLTLLGLFFLLEMPVNFVTSIFGSVLVGITGDNGIQYLLAGREGDGSFESGVDTNGVASFAASLAIAGIALLFCFSSFSHMRSLGALFAAGFGLSFFGDVWLAKVRWRQPVGKETP